MITKLSSKALFFALPVLHALSFISLFAYYLGSTLPSILASSLLIVLLVLLSSSLYSLLRSPLISKILYPLLIIGILALCASGFEYSFFKSFLSFSLFNYFYGILAVYSFTLFRQKYLWLYLFLLIAILIASGLFFLTIPSKIFYVGGIIQNPDGVNDLYQSFGGYYLRLALPPWFIVLLTPYRSVHKLLHFPPHHFLRYRLLLLLLLILSFPILFALGVKKELFILSFMVVALFINIIQTSKPFVTLPLFISSLIPLYFLAPTLNTLIGDDTIGYALDRFSFSLTARFTDFFPTVYAHLVHSFPFGDPFVHVYTHTSNYIHSSIVSAFVFGGILSGILFSYQLLILFSNLRGLPLSLIIFCFLVTLVSVIATTYDWLFLWFMIGFYMYTKVWLRKLAT